MPSRPLAVSTNLIRPGRSVTNSTFVPGAKASAHGSSKVPRSSIVNPAAAAFPPFGCAGEALQLVSGAAARAKAIAEMSVFMRPDNASSAAGLRERIVVGGDKAGRGRLAGPVVAAAEMLSKQCTDGLDGTKKLT